MHHEVHDPTSKRGVRRNYAQARADPVTLRPRSWSPRAGLVRDFRGLRAVGKQMPMSYLLPMTQRLARPYLSGTSARTTRSRSPSRLDPLYDPDNERDSWS
jgi:hypothetical protein